MTIIQTLTTGAQANQHFIKGWWISAGSGRKGPAEIPVFYGDPDSLVAIKRPIQIGAALLEPASSGVPDRPRRDGAIS